MITRIRKKIQMRAAELTALVVQGLFVSASTFVYEVVFFTIAQDTWGYIRLLYNGIKYITFHIPAKLDDYLKTTFLRTSKNRFYEWMADGLALSIHQVPIYIVSAVIFGISVEKIALISLFYLADNFAFGGLYGILLKWMREKFITKAA